MESLLEKIKAGVLWDFPGGVHPPQRKKLSNQTEISLLPLAEHYWVPVKQHIGAVNHILVASGDKVKKGQALTAFNDKMSVPVHAPTSGTIGKIEPHVSAHPSGIPALSIQIIADGLDEWCEISPKIHFRTLPKSDVIGFIQAAGVAGLGGAAFPTHVKQTPNQPCEILLINGVECEPYITSDDRVMREHADEVIHGIEVLAYILEPKLVVIAIEDNKPEAINAMEAACAGKANFVVRVLPTKYPAGGEKQIIQVITNMEVPKGKISADIGVVSQNVGTVYAIYKAIYLGEPLIDRVVTVTGENIETAGNYRLPIGTPIAHVLNHVKHDNQHNERVIMGGPMMGFTVLNKQVPVTKITNCLLIPTQQELPDAPPEQACIRCGECADACPASLLPQQLYWHSKAKEHDKAQAYNLFDCIECGACAFVCPSDIPLVQYYRQTKAEIREANEEKIKAEKAKERFETRNARLERDKQERLDKHKRSAELRKQSLNTDQSAQDKIAAAMARAKAKKAQKNSTNDITKTDQNAEPNTLENTTLENSAVEKNAVESNISQSNSPIKNKAQEAIARAKAKREAKLNNNASTEEQNTTAPPSHKVESDLDHSPNEPVEADPIKSKAQAAIARAKAKREAKLKNADATATNSQKASASDSASQKEAEPKPENQRAATLTHDSTIDSNNDEIASTVSPIKLKAQAAIARAKAKKAAKLAEESKPAAHSSAESDKTTLEPKTAADQTDEQVDEHLQTSTTNEPTEISEAMYQTELEIDPIKSKAQAAIARAKAKRQQKMAEQASVTQPENAKAEANIQFDAEAKSRAKAAIERAKARRDQANQLAHGGETGSSSITNTTTASSLDSESGNSEDENANQVKAAKVKAALAKAKAKRQKS
ncbi:electron transport complex subunit RsxC [Algibacillus agarilyticus]|uniref:electron transport complex subunit RsxC n=1 Tax=Algibacillus agarilyticus TaxID=2234133 RepID=UPI000DD01F17|nr:electron transport complex subunit RsxC [Algibacillus agarilyticus]